MCLLLQRAADGRERAAAVAERRDVPVRLGRAASSGPQCSAAAQWSMRPPALRASLSSTPSSSSSPLVSPPRRLHPSPSRARCGQTDHASREKKETDAAVHKHARRSQWGRSSWMFGHRCLVLLLHPGVCVRENRARSCLASESALCEPNQPASQPARRCARLPHRQSNRPPTRPARGRNTNTRTTEREAVALTPLSGPLSCSDTDSGGECSCCPSALASIASAPESTSRRCRCALTLTPPSIPLAHPFHSLTISFLVRCADHSA